MKRNNIIIVSLLAFMLGFFSVNPANAQVFLTEEDYNNFRTETTPEFPLHFEPEHDTTWDYTPIGNGIWLLGCLGGAYLLGKRRKKED